MGSYDSADICDLVGLYILDTLRSKFPDSSIGLYRDDGLAVSMHKDGHALDTFRKNLITTFNNIGLKALPT